MSEPASMYASLFYLDPRAALDWLQRAFGFEIAFMVTDDDGDIGYSEMSYGEGRISVNGEWTDPELAGTARMRSPLSVEGVNTQFMRVNLPGGLEAHCEQARAAGAVITQEPLDQFYGHRTYRALDPEGHVWTFSVPIAVVSDEARARGAQWKTRQASLKEQD